MQNIAVYHCRTIAHWHSHHTVNDKVEAAYRRGEMLVKRHKLLADWCAFCNGARGRQMTRQAILISFVLWVTNDSEPPYQRVTFDSYEDCFAAGRSQVDTMAQMSPDISWQCVSDDRQ